MEVLTSLRRPLDAVSLRAALTAPAGPWRSLDVVAETSSTNADLLRRSADGTDIGGAILIAEHQTAGMGRLGRRWVGIPGAQLLVSAGIDTAGVDPRWWGWIPLAAGLAVCDTVRSAGAAESAQVGVKWPNDVMSRHGKLAGVLAAVASPERAVVLGIGLNVSLGAEEIGEPGAASLVDVGIAGPERQHVATELLGRLADRLDRWRAAGGDDAQLRADYRARSTTLGMRVKALLPDRREVIGVAQAVDDHGQLEIRADDGTDMIVSAADVVHLRPLDLG